MAEQEEFIGVDPSKNKYFWSPLGNVAQDIARTNDFSFKFVDPAKRYDSNYYFKKLEEGFKSEGIWAEGTEVFMRGRGEQFSIQYVRAKNPHYGDDLKLELFPVTEILYLSGKKKSVLAAGHEWGQEKGLLGRVFVFDLDTQQKARSIGLFECRAGIDVFAGSVEYEYSLEIRENVDVQDNFFEQLRDFFLETIRTGDKKREEIK